MAGIALRCRTDVGSTLRLRIDGKITSTVAGRTLSGRARMTHLGGSKNCVVLVAGVA